MRIYNILILLVVLFVTPYAFAQIPFCPCDTLELDDGTTGNDIIEALCPGGSPGPETSITVNQQTVDVHSSTLAYLVTEVLIPPICEIDLIDDNFNGTSLSNQDVQACRASLIARCGLLNNPIPTLSEWGMIAMAGVLGIVGLYIAARRRKVTA